MTQESICEALVSESFYESVLDSIRGCVVEPAVGATARARSLHSLAPNEVVPLLIGSTVEEMERELVLHTLARCEGNRTHAAQVLGMSVRTLRNKIRIYAARGIDVPPPDE